MTRKFALALGLTLTAIGFASPSHAQTTPYCREYTRHVTIGGVSQEAYGTACQQPDGSWQIMNQANGAPGPGAVVNPAYTPVPPPPVGSDVTYIIHDDVPIYVDPGYIHYGPWHGYYHPYPYAPYYYGHGGYGYYHHHFND